MTQSTDISELIKRMASPALRTSEVVNQYYTLCIPFYREFLGNHWHTGYYPPEGPLGPHDQLRMECHIAASAGLTVDCKVLDVGCGIGGPACHLAQITGARIHGLTPNPVQLELARSLALTKNVADKVCFDLGDAGALPYADASFDVVLFFESACHFPDRTRFFHEAYRVLRQGGRLAGEDWLAGEALSIDQLDRYIRPICNTWAIPTLGTRAGYAEGMRAAGFTVREAVDLRHEMALLRGFMVDPGDRMQVSEEMQSTADPVRRMIMESLLHLGEAAEAGAFTVGRFLAVKNGNGS
ncbi:MAG TPA: methyltransferase domain-containing protein [Usitatibacteraceae bacterium]